MENPAEAAGEGSRDLLGKLGIEGKEERRGRENGPRDP